MPTLDQIKHQINSLPHKYIFYTKKEINYLPQILAEGEDIKALTSGFMDNKTWLAVCTNRRIIFINCGMFFGLQTVQMNLDRVQSIDSSYVIYFGSIRMWDGASSFVLNMVLKSSIDPFVRTVREQIDAYRKLMFNEVTGHAYAQQQHGQPQQQAQAHQAAAHHPQQQAQAHYAHPQQAQAAQQPSAPISQPVTEQSDISSQLERLAALKDAGQLTQEEFDAQKQKLLAG